MSEQFITKRDEVKALLRKLFRSEDADLDFGIYRIMNYKRREIEQFIERDLIETAEAEFKQYARAGIADLEKELEQLRAEINSDFGAGTIDTKGRVTQNHDAPKIQRYLRAQEEYREAALTEEQVNDVFNHVCEFFSRYYNDGDFITSRKDSWKSKYSIPYKGEEVTLHWATKNMYYIKTGEFFKKYSFKAGRYRINFVLVDVQVETGNMKGEKKFFILSDEEPVQTDETTREVEIKFNYRKLNDAEKSNYGTRNIQATIVSETLEKMRPLLESSSIVGILRPRGSEEKSLMEKHLNAYVDRNTKDFFIHKDLKGFLERGLDFYLKNEVWSLDELESSSESGARLLAAKAKAIRGISLKIIEFLSQIEEFQKRLFEKKKFVLKTDYCLTLDLVLEELYEEIGRNQKQVEEWKELYKLDEITKDSFYSTKGKTTLTVNFLKEYKYLVLDTKFFTQDFRDQLLESYDDVDDCINGLIIKSENYHSLKLIQHKYEEKIDVIYIDPPYNTGRDDFIYKDAYRHSSWISLMYDRIYESIKFLNNNGSIFISIDYNENSKLRELLENIGLIYRNTIITSRIKKSIRERDSVPSLNWGHGYIQFFGKYEGALIRPPILKDKRTKKERWHAFDAPGIRPTMEYELFGKKPPEGRHWMYSYNRAMGLVKKGELRKNPRTGSIQYRVPKSEGVQLDTKWTDLLESDSKWNFTTEKNVKLIERILEMIPNTNIFILDFFAGSGTTANAAINFSLKTDANVNYILMEMGDYFESIIIPRMKKSVFIDNWKNELPNKLNKYSHFFKYQYLEQYEDTLNNIEFISPDGTTQKTLEHFPDYFISYMLDYETRDSPTRLSIEQFKTPFNYKIKTLSSGEELEEPVDLVETFNYLLGLHIKRIRAYKDGDRVYRAVFGERDREQVAVIWRNTSDIDLRKDKRFIEENILADSTFDTIYVNGDSYVRNAKPIEPEFRRLMGA